eukprot:Lankesteria_metandrocarpae@DN1050_c0_g1_i1.p1
MDTVDKWHVPKFTREDNKHPTLLEESSFSTLYPQYREKYLKDNWGEIKRVLAEHHIAVEINTERASLTVRTTPKTWDPYIIVKARDMMKLLARSVPVRSAARVLEDEVFSDLIKIRGYVRNKEKYVKRRQRLVGPNGSTLKAIELLSQCYVLVQGQTVSVIGSIKGLKSVRRLVEDCMNNKMHPVYHVKRLMIRKELEADPVLAKENWDRFLPKFRKKNIQRRKPTSSLKKKKSQPALYPEPPTPRKEDLAIESGEYFAAAAIKQQQKVAGSSSGGSTTFTAKRNSAKTFDTGKHQRKLRSTSTAEGRNNKVAGGGGANRHRGNSKGNMHGGSKPGRGAGGGSSKGFAKPKSNFKKKPAARGQR